VRRLRAKRRYGSTPLQVNDDDAPFHALFRGLRGSWGGLLGRDLEIGLLVLNALLLFPPAYLFDDERR
jgi:hypothetical protein